MAVKRPGENLEVMTLNGFYRSDVKPLVEENSDHLTLDYVMIHQNGNRCLCMACDQDGCFKTLEHNFDMITKSGSHKFLSHIKGNAVFLCYQWEKEIYDFELLDMTDEELEIVRHIVSPEYQKGVRMTKEHDKSILENTLVFESIDSQSNDDFMPGLVEIPVNKACLYLSVFGLAGLDIKLYTDMGGIDGYRVRIRRAKDGENISFSGIRTATGFCVPTYPMPENLDIPGANEIMNSRTKKVRLIRECLQSSGVGENIYVDSMLARIITEAADTFERTYRGYLPTYLIYLYIMTDVTASTLEKIEKILRVGSGMYSPDRRRKYIEERLAGILPPEEITKIEIENWRQK